MSGETRFRFSEANFIRQRRITDEELIFINQVENDMGGIVRNVCSRPALIQTGLAAKPLFVSLAPIPRIDEIRPNNLRSIFAKANRCSTVLNFVRERQGNSFFFVTHESASGVVIG